MTKHLLIPVNDDGKCVIVEPDKRENKKLTWKCSIECKPLLQNEIDAIVSLKEAFSGNIKMLRQNLAKIDINCPNGHYFKKSAQPTDKRLRGHPLVCHGNDSECKSTLRILRSVSTHYKQLRKFLKLVYKALKYDFMIHCIDNGLHFTDVTLLMKLVNVKQYESLLCKGEESDDVHVDSKHVNVDISSILRDPYLEDNLHIDYVELMNNFQKEVDDYPINICCCCEQLHQKVNVSVVKFTDHLDDTIWPRIKKYLLENNPNADSEIFYICNYCKPKIRAGKLPPRCVLNGLKTESIPVELTKLDSLSCQLIQKAKCYQTIVRLGTYTAKVPTYNSLKACSGAMFFLPLPMSKTLATLDEVKGSLPNPELYVILNGQPTKNKVVWRSLVNVDKVKLAVQKLKDINWIYKVTDVDSVDDATKEIVEVTTDSTMLEKATKEEIVGFQMFTIRNMDNKLSTECDIDQYKVLNIREQPINNRQKYLDVMCFPTLFPTRQFGEYHPREVKLSNSEYIKSRLLNKDSRFRKNAQYVFYLFWQKEMRELSAGVYNLLKSTKSQPMSVAALLSKVRTSDDELESNLSTMLQTVRGSKQYWFIRQGEVKTMIREYGPPTIFLTLSCAEYDSPDITDYLHKVNDVPPSYNIGKLCTEDPISVSKKFSLKFRSFFKVVIKNGSVLGTVDHYYWKKEYQARGAPHYHILLWICDAPVIGQDPPEVVLRWIEERITCHIPDKDLCPELHRLVTKYQLHKCSSYCKRKRKCGTTYITRCKFGFPREVTNVAEIKDVDKVLKSRNKIYSLVRTDSEIRVNDYNPLLLLMWKANMDIQFVAESSLALAHYVSGYVTKAEKSNMQDMWQEVSENTSVYSRLWKFGLRCIRSRECGLYEASDLLLGDNLFQKSVNVKWINVCMPHKRNRRLKDYNKLQDLAQNDPENENIFEQNILDDFYPNRPLDLEDVCLYDFVANYNYSGFNKSGNRIYSKRKTPLLPSHKMFDPEKENERESYFYSLIFLFVPFRDESGLLLEGETAEVAFNRLLPNHSDCSLYHKKLQKMLKASSYLKQVNDAREQEEKVSKLDDDEPQLFGEAKNAMNDLVDINKNLGGDLTLHERMSMLNNDQLRIFHKIKNHLLHQQLHETKHCECDFEPLCMFVSGVGGTGKSFLIEAVKALVNELWPSEELACAISAPTGLAAFNVGGVTLHRLFQLPIEHESKTAAYWALSKASQKVMKTYLKGVKIFVVDEVSMVSSLNLAYLHLRLEELFGATNWFGGKNVLFVGDILQLPPVNGRPVFEKITAQTIKNKLGCATAVNIWKESIVYDELTINERQKQDKQFSEMLDSVRRGLPTNETLALLEKRVIDVDIDKKFNELSSLGTTPVCLFPTRKACSEFNNIMLQSLSSDVHQIDCIDEVDESSGTVKWSKRAQQQLEKLNDDCNLTAGLEAHLIMAVGARVMLRRNIDTAKGLVNGALGTVLNIAKTSITVQFDHIAEPYQVRLVKSKFIVMKNFFVYRKQFPLILAFAVTIHKCQGLSLDCAIVDLSDKVFSPGMAYVALSRVRTLDGLHLTAFDPKSIMVSVESLEESNRLRKTYCSDLPLYDIPSKQQKQKCKLIGKLDFDDHICQNPAEKEGPKNRKRKASSNLQDCSKPIKKQRNSTIAKKTVPLPSTDDKPSKKARTTSSTKRRACSPPLDSKPSEKLCTTGDNDVIYDKTTTRNTDHNSRANTRVNPLRVKRWNPVTEDWQRNACAILGLKFVRYNGVTPGGPTVNLGSASHDKTKRISGDGNCLFRSLSYVVTGCPSQHKEIRKIIVEYMPSIYHILISRALVDYTSVQQYIQETRMDRLGVWGTDTEMFTFSHILETPIFTYNDSIVAEHDQWSRYALHDMQLQQFESMSMYLYFSGGNHFQPILNIVN